MNRADKSLGYVRKVKNDRPCVFISHKNEDQHIAIELGEFLMKTMNVDIYLDIYDLELQEAVSVDNDAKIVESIVEGLKISDILLCVISDKTKLSWWVPYEIGMADNLGIRIASIKTKEIDEFPSFLKTKKTLNNISDVVEFILNNGRYGALFYTDKQRERICQKDLGHLNRYFD